MHLKYIIGAYGMSNWKMEQLRLDCTCHPCSGVPLVYFLIMVSDSELDFFTDDIYHLTNIQVKAIC